MLATFNSTLAIETSGLTKRYGARLAVDNLDLAVRQGEIFGFLGPNGSGKTTTIRLLLGLLRATSGGVRLNGRELAEARRTVLPQVGSMVEQPGFHPYLSGRDNLRSLCRLLSLPDRAADLALEKTGLAPRGRDRYATYSLGMKQRLGVAGALLGSPRLLILDEPTNGLDPHGIIEMRNLLREQAASGVTVFLSSHILSEVSVVCDRVAIVRSGRLLLVDRVPDLLARDAPFVIDTPNPEAAQAALTTAAPGRRIRVEGDSVVVESPGLRGRDIVSALVAGGVAVDGLRRAELTLEEIFLRITDDDAPQPLATPPSPTSPSGGARLSTERPGGETG